MNYKGLTTEEVLKSRKQYGSNEIKHKKQNTFLKLFVESLGDPMIKILLVVLAIKLVFLFANFDWYETLGIMIAIFLASFISSISEYGSNKAFEKLIAQNNYQEIKAKRNDNLILLNINELVVNDIVCLNAGDFVPADGIIVEGEVSINESAINGESNDVIKNTLPKHNELYKGTIVTLNECIMKVTSVGEKTLFGSIAKDLQSSTQDSPLKIRLRHLAKIISKIGYIGAFLVFFSYMFSIIVIANKYNASLIYDTITNTPLLINYLISAITLSVTIIIVSVPEGLPMMVALVLSTNMKKLLKQHILVKKLVGIETAGSLNYLLTDKTGTLTNGIMSVFGIVNYEGRIFSNELELLNDNSYYQAIGESIILNNECQIINNKITNGNSTDKALISFITYNTNSKIINKTLFSSVTKYSSVSTIDKTYFKGAPEIILPKCINTWSKVKTTSKIDLNHINYICSNYMHKGYRIIALAEGKNDRLINLKFIGLVLLKDEIRKDAKMGLKLIEKAGVKTIMITGDSLDTALYIGNELELLKKDSLSLTGNDLESLTDEELKSNIDRIKIIARAKPNDKSRLVKIISEMNLVVGMTGDGINDASALKKADVGFAMGSGTDVAKEASDLVILDDDINSISKAILFGRTIFKNIRKFIIFQLTVNICAMTLSIIGPFIGVNTPVTVIQMLWINMIMDTLAGLAFAYEEPELEYMEEKPKTKHEPIINKYMYGEILFTGIYSSLLCISFLKLPFFKCLIRTDPNNKYFYTAFFCLFVFIGIFNAFNTRTNRYNLLYRISKNKMFIVVFGLVSLFELYFIYHGKTVFRTYGLTLKELIIILSLAATVIPVDFIRKYLLSKKVHDYI